jgi:hypothetical protein
LAFEGGARHFGACASARAPAHRLWGVLQIVEFLIEGTGFPDWVSPAAVILLLIGLPIVLATAIVQESTPSRSGITAPEAALDGDARKGIADVGVDAPASPVRIQGRRGLFTWRNALLGGAAAFALLGLAVGGFYVMRNLGIGPAATLHARGLLDSPRWPRW